MSRTQAFDRSLGSGPDLSFRHPSPPASVVLVYTVAWTTILSSEYAGRDVAHEHLSASLIYVRVPVLRLRYCAGSMTILSPSNQTPLPQLSFVLERLGLASYLKVLTKNGFRTWETVLDITEEDLTALNFKLGHRRVLQREIATYRGVPPAIALESDNPDEQRSLSTAALECLANETTTPPPREKRRYRRHARPDNNAPKKPKTACMLTPLIRVRGMF
jgi:hypothetical protein